MTNLEPRVHQVSESEAGQKAREIFQQIKSQSGKIPKWMRVMANCEDVLIGFFTLFKAIMDDAPVDRLLKWRLALRVSDLNKCEFCVSVAKQQLKLFGLTEKEINSLQEKTSDEAVEIAVQFAEESTLHAYQIDDSLMEKLRKYYSDEQIVELTSVVGLFNFINRFNDALRVLPETA